MNRLAILVVLTVCTTGLARAQNHKHEADLHSAHHGDGSDQTAVRATIDALFDAMRAGSGEAVRAVFGEQARLMSTAVRDGVPVVHETPISGFADAVDKAAEGSWDERIWDVMIHVNGNLATAWTPYAFYHDGNFSHCGVNAFQIAKLADGWKIIQLTDTRQREGCEIPDEVSGK